MSGPDEAPDSAEESGFSMEDLVRFRNASTQFHESATEMMAASVRVQMLVLDDAKLTLTVVADGLSGAIRKQRMLDEI